MTTQWRFNSDRKTYIACFMDDSRLLRFRTYDEMVAYAYQREKLTITAIGVHDSETDEEIARVDDIIRDSTDDAFVYSVYCAWDVAEDDYLFGIDKGFATVREARDFATENAPLTHCRVKAICRSYTAYDTLDIINPFDYADEEAV